MQIIFRKALAFSMKKHVYLIDIHKIKCIYAKSHAFRLLNWVSITSLFLQNYPMDNFDRIIEFMLL